jgi:UTP:GlnB (protein PII) uridylyltransferase
MTVGERAEDVFYVTDLENRPLDAGAAVALKERKKEAMDRRAGSVGLF